MVQEAYEKIVKYKTAELRERKEEIEACLKKKTPVKHIASSFGVSVYILNKVIRQLGLEHLKSTPLQNIKDPEPGTRFNSWTFIKVLGYRSGEDEYSLSSLSVQTSNVAIYYECKCDCGEVKPVQKRYLFEGKSKACIRCASRNRSRGHEQE